MYSRLETTLSFTAKVEDVLSTLKCCAILLFFLLFPLFAAISQWSSDPYENTIVAYQAYDPQMVSDGSGGAIIVWWSSTDYGLHAQRLDKYGYARWGNNGVFVGGIGWYQGENFGLCEDGNGGCVVSFADVYGLYPPYYYSRLYAQRIDSLGNRLWGNAGIPVCGLDSIYVSESHVVTDGMGGFFVIWDDIRHGTDSVWLYGQHLDEDGTASWTQNGISISGETNYDNLYPAIVSGGPGYALAFWHKQSDYLWGQRMDSDGSIHWGEGGLMLSHFLRYSNTYHTDNHGGVVVSGIFRNGEYYDIYSQRIDSLGNALWGENGILVTQSIMSGPWSTCANDSGIFYFWRSGVVGSFQVIIQRTDYNGNILWDSLGITISNPESSNGCPINTSTGSCEVINAWYQQIDTCLLANKFDPEGNRIWTSEDVVLSHNINFAADLHAIDDLSGGGILCWTIYPEILYAQQISANGNLGEVLSVGQSVPDINAVEIRLMPNYPNPFNESTVIPVVIPQLMPNLIPRVFVYNILGQEVRQIDIDSPRTGINLLHWNGQNRNGVPVASGIYFVQINSRGKGECIPIMKLR